MSCQVYLRRGTVLTVLAGISLLQPALAPMLRADDGSITKKLTPEEAKAAKQQEKRANAAVAKAAAALTKEFEAYEQNLKSPIRTKSDYFEKSPDPDVTPEAIVRALHRGYGDLATSLYVHWQLLSGISGTVDDTLSRDLLEIYADAPLGPPHPGLSQGEQVQLETELAGKGEKDVAPINSRYAEQVSQWKIVSTLFSNYRNELPTKIPVSYLLIRAEFHDAVQRAAAGIDAEATVNAAIESGRNWALGDVPREQLGTLYDDVSSVLQAMGTGRTPAFPPAYYSTVEWNEKAKKPAWRSGQARFISREELTAFQQTLVSQATQSDGIKIKSTKSDGN